MNDLCVLIEKIPAAFWGVLAGSFFSLGGVVISNRANDRRLREQLTHERQLKAKEREHSLRKEIYLDATEAISTGITTLGRFANLEIPHEELTERYLEQTPSIAKVHVVANEETIVAVTKLSSEMSGAYLRLSAKRGRLIQEKTGIDALKPLIEASNRERSRMLELMKQHNLDGEDDQRKWAVISQNFEFEQKRLADWEKEHVESLSALYQKQLALMQECIQESNKLSRLLVPALAAVRRELELPFDETSYSRLLEDALTKIRADIENFLKQVQP